jgi:hypothetical protein
MHVLRQMFHNKQIQNLDNRNELNNHTNNEEKFFTMMNHQKD